MGWRSYLLVTVMASFWSAVQLEGIIYTNVRSNSKIVCCFYNGTAPKPWNIRLKKDKLRLPAVPEDDFTICYTAFWNFAFALSLEERAFEYKCIWPDNQRSSKAIITSFSFLEIVGFRCFYTDTKAELECSFYQDRKEDRYKEFLLVMDRKFRARCFLYKCSLQYPANFQGFNRSFTIETLSHGILQKNSFYLTDIEMRKPGWPSNEPHIEQSGFAICVNFGFPISQPFNKSDSYEWKVELKPQNPAIKKKKAKVISYTDAGFNQRKDLCFRIPHLHYQTHEVHLTVRFNHEDAHWTHDEKKLTFTTKASVPDRPPEFMDNGFFFDPKKNEIHVFWLELKELEFNGPNFTYSVATDTGKKPLLKGNSSAVFYDWDLLKQSTILIWSQNSMGRSSESNNRTVPILTNYKRYQPRNLQFHLVDNTLSWDPPLEDKNVTGFYVFSCHAHTNSNHICENGEQLQRNGWRSRWARSYQFQDSNSSLNMAVVADYIDSGGYMKWYGDPSESLEEKPGSLGLGISLSVAVVIVFALTPLIYFSFQRWKLKKINEIVITLPPIFDPIAMDRLRQKNVIFAYIDDLPVETKSSASSPWRIFLDSKETAKIVGRKSAQSTRIADPLEEVSSFFTEMGTAQSTTNPDPPEVVYQIMERKPKSVSFAYS